MRHFFSRLLAAVALVVALALPAAGQKLSAPKTTTLVTVIGSVSNTNRGPYDDANDVFFKHLGIQFTKAAAFDLEMLASLPQHTVKTDFPMGGRVHRFTGPRIADVLAAAGASGTTVKITALDGYAAELPIAQIEQYGVILAISKNGKSLGIGDYGPAWVIFPRLETPALKDRNDDGWVWSVAAIAVE